MVSGGRGWHTPRDTCGPLPRQGCSVWGSCWGPTAGFLRMCLLSSARCSQHCLLSLQPLTPSRSILEWKEAHCSSSGCPPGCPAPILLPALGGKVCCVSYPPTSPKHPTVHAQVPQPDAAQLVARSRDRTRQTKEAFPGLLELLAAEVGVGGVCSFTGLWGRGSSSSGTFIYHLGGVPGETPLWASCAQRPVNPDSGQGFPR